MKHKLLKSVLLGLVLTAVAAAVNAVLGLSSGWIIGISIVGGEIISQVGFGIMLNRYYPMTFGGASEAARMSVRFDPVSFVATVLALTAIVYLIRLIAAKTRASRTKG